MRWIQYSSQFITCLEDENAHANGIWGIISNSGKKRHDMSDHPLFLPVPWQQAMKKV